MCERDGVCVSVCVSLSWVCLSGQLYVKKQSFFPDPPGTHVSGVQSVSGRESGETDGENVGPAEPEQRDGA